MAENVSRLAIAITTDGAIQATTELKKLTVAAKQTEVQAGKTTSAATLLAKEQVEAAKEAKKLEDATSKLIKDLELEARSVGKTADEIKLMKLELAGATKAQLDAARAAIANKNAQIELAEEAEVITDNFGDMNQATRGLSYQLQDIAVQLQSGTPLFTILGQQGSQLASVLVLAEQSSALLFQLARCWAAWHIQCFRLQEAPKNWSRQSETLEKNMGN